jgi:hypothetical protein
MLNGSRKLALDENLTGLWRAPVRQIKRDIRWKHPILGLVLGDDFRHQRVDRKAVAGVADRRLRDLAEAHRAEALERSDPGIGRRRHHGAENPLRNRAGVVRLEVIGPDRLRPRAEARDRDDAILRGRIDDDRRHARKIHVFRLHDAERNPGRNSGVDCIAACLQNLEAGLGGQVMTGRHHVARPHDRRAVGHVATLLGRELTLVRSCATVRYWQALTDRQHVAMQPDFDPQRRATLGPFRSFSPVWHSRKSADHRL